VFGALSPVSVNAARQRLEAGAAKAPQGRRGQVAGEDVRAYTSLPARRPYVGPVARAALASRRVALARLVRAVAALARGATPTGATVIFTPSQA